MRSTSLHCHRCNTLLPGDATTLPSITECPLCAAPVTIQVFPAYTKPPSTSSVVPSAVQSGEASCFVHTQKRAVIPCDRCGRFLCALCDFPIGNQHLCPGCVEDASAKKELGELENHRVRWDVVVWYLLVVPVVFCGWIIPLTAPTAFVLAILKRQSPPSLVARSRLWLKLGMILAMLEFVGFIALMIYLIQFANL